MAGIAGVNKSNQIELVEKMLNKISHRGNYGRKVFSTTNSTFGIVTTKLQSRDLDKCALEKTVRDYLGEGHYSAAIEKGRSIELIRDPLGVAPLYYGFMDDGTLVFSSEVKGLSEVVKNIKELLPGHKLIDNTIQPYYKLVKTSQLNEKPESIAGNLRKILTEAVKQITLDKEFGSWLSGGLDSSGIASLANPFVKKLHTFSAGIKDAPDLKFARQMAEYLKSVHHEVIVSINDMISVLPKVIYQLESFDALLVRSSITNYFVAKEASQYVENILSGEGGDELFGGYIYLKELTLPELENELLDITGRLHNTALQRVDRCASAFGINAHLVFLDPKVVSYAFKIPVEYKIKNGIEKWILRLALKDLLPEQILKRTKAKFWEGAGVGDLLYDYAENKITSNDFKEERVLKNGWVLNSKEELMYYRIFKEHFGHLENFDWMGRTKYSPKDKS